MGLYLQPHLRDGELDGKRPERGGDSRKMRRITVRWCRYDLVLSWFRPASQSNADPPFGEHLGGAGFYNLIRIYPTRGTGIAVMGNAAKYHIDAVSRLALAD
jgi:CubicO group peptidase (beta-lactamase class C family)